MAAWACACAGLVVGDVMLTRNGVRSYAGAELHYTALSTRIAPLPPNFGTAPPPYLACTAPIGTATDAQPSAPLPTCILNIAMSIPAGSPNVLVPAHSLLFALHSPVFRRVLASTPFAPPPPPPPASDASTADAATLHLPVYSLTLPCALVMEPLYHLIHHRLLPDSIRLPAPPPSPADAPAGTDADALAGEHLQRLLGQAQYIFGLWKTLRALAWEDEGCWAEVGEAWGRVVVAVEGVEGKRVARGTRERTEAWLGR